MLAYSLGVIGGADGPTAIFVTGPDGASMVIFAVVAIALAVGIILMHRRKK